jgi:hypothetical protein
VNRAEAGVGAGNIGELVDVIAVVLLGQLLGRDPRHAFTEVAGDQQ